MKRIVILGSSGTGKTTVCRRLGEKLHINTLHLDSVYWEKNWNNIDKDHFDRYMIEYLRKHDTWVIDGNYTNNKHFKYRLDLADVIIILDFGKQVSLQGIHMRANEFKHQVRSDMAEGCVEGIDQVFLKYVAGFHKVKSKFLIASAMKYKEKKQVFVFKNRNELYDWYNSL
jgi:adenylate kinase family enzyme